MTVPSTPFQPSPDAIDSAHTTLRTAEHNAGRSARLLRWLGVVAISMGISISSTFHEKPVLPLKTTPIEAVGDMAFATAWALVPGRRKQAKMYEAAADGLVPSPVEAATGPIAAATLPQQVKVELSQQAEGELLQPPQQPEA